MSGPDTYGIATDFQAWDAWARGALSEPYQEMLEHWRLYLSSRKDHRKSWEKTWRAHTGAPYPYTIIEGKTAAVSDTVNASTPNIQCLGVGDEDVAVARKVENLLDYTLRENSFRLRSEEVIRESAVQGTSALKVVFRHDTAKVRQSDQAAEALFDQRVAALQRLGIDVPADPNEYEAFRQSDKAKVIPFPLPTHPRNQFHEVTTFQAPAFERVSIFDLLFDPLEGDWTKQRRVAQRMVKPIKWVRDRAGDDPSLPFDAAAVERAIAGMSEDAFNTYQSQLADMMGVGSATFGYYGRKDLCILHEVWDPENEERPWYMMLNLMEVITKDCFPPYGHGENPIHLHLNLPQPGKALGLSELKAPKKLFEELWAMRDLLQDGVTMSTLGVYTRLAELGIPEISKVLRPGASIAVPRMDALKRLDMGGVHPDVWNLLPYLKGEIDDTTSITSQMRGAPATVGRVSASEAERRFSSAMLRIKTAAVRFEEQWRRPIRQALWLWYQQGPEDLLVRVAGAGAEQYTTTVSKEELLQALSYDFRLVGPSQAVNKDMVVQQAMQFFSSFGALLPTYRQLALAAQVYDLMGLQNRAQVIPDSDVQAALAAAMQPPAPAAAVDPATGQLVQGAPAPAESGQPSIPAEPEGQVEDAAEGGVEEPVGMMEEMPPELMAA